MTRLAPLLTAYVKATPSPLNSSSNPGFFVTKSTLDNSVPSDAEHPQDANAREIYQLIDEIFRLPGGVPGETEDIYKPLSAPIPSQKGEGIPVTL